MNMKNIISKALSKLALAAASTEMNSTCSAVFHQRKAPDAVHKLKKK